MTRAEAATKLCERLTRDVDAIAPPGIGEWPEAFDIVGDASASFMLPISTWQATAKEADRLKVRCEYNRVLGSWREAIARYEESRRPASQ